MLEALGQPFKLKCIVNNSIVVQFNNDVHIRFDLKMSKGEQNYSQMLIFDEYPDYYQIPFETFEK